VAKIIIEGGHYLQGTVRIGGAKNAVLPILAASILASTGTSYIEDVPDLLDVKHMAHTIAAIGAAVERRGTTVYINARNINTVEPPHDLVRKMRASFGVAGPLLSRFGQASIALPGGCNIGPRPVDLHIKGLEALGARVRIEGGCVHLQAPPGGLRGARIYLDIPSVGATQNIMMAACLANGHTVIENAAKEPENVDLATYLNAMGAHVRGAGTDIIRIDGVDAMQGANHKVIPDRIEAGTFLIAGALMGGGNGVYVENALSQHLLPLIAKLEEAGVLLKDEVAGIRVYPSTSRRLRALDLKTNYYPAYPTDLQAQMLAAMTCGIGISTITETVFENRFMHVAELQRMGASVQVEGRTAIIDGIERLSGAEVTATDLRAGAALVLAGLTADGVTVVRGLHHIDRGYDKLVDKFRGIGAKIGRVEEVQAVEALLA